MCGIYNKEVYFNNVCKMQNDFIKGEITKNEFKKRIEKENLKYSAFLERENANLKFNLKMEHKWNGLRLESSFIDVENPKYERNDT